MTPDPRNLDADGLKAQTRSLRGLARALVGEHDADDLVQDAWVPALARPPKQGWTLGSWLRGITRRHARQRSREQQRRNRREQAAATSEVHMPDDSIERIDLLRHMLDQVRRLDEPYRSTILLRYFEGLSPKAVARRQGVPHATVRTRLRRGIELLRQRMDGAVEGGRRAWVLPLVPFIAVPDAGPIATLTEGAARLAETAGQGALAMGTKKSVVAAGLLLAGGLVTVTTWPSLFGEEPVVGEPGVGAPLAHVKQVEPGAGTITGKASVADRREVIEKQAGKKWAGARPKSFTLMTVSGVVRDDKNRPLAGAEISTGKSKSTAVTGENGSYTLQVPIYILKANSNASAVLASAKGYCSATKSVRLDGAAPVQVDFTLRPGFRVTGRVTTKDGEGIAGAWLEMFPKGPRKVVTDEQGFFRVTDLDPAAPRHYLQASAKGYMPAGKSVHTAGKSAGQDLVLVLKRGATVRGVVYGPRRQPLKQAKLSLTAGKTRIHAVTDEKGVFELAGARPGKQTLEVLHKQYAPALRWIEVPAPGQGLELVIDLVPGEVLTGVVRDVEGRPIHSAWIEVRLSQRKIKLAGSKTNERGEFELRRLPAGELILACSAEGHLSKRRHRVPVGQRHVMLRLEKAARIAGRVIDLRTGKPVTRFTVRFVAAGEGTVGTSKPRSGKGRGRSLSKKQARGADPNWFGDGVSFSDPQGRWDTGGDGVPVGFVTGVEVRAEGYAPAVVPRVAARVDARHDDLWIKMDAGTTLSGQVVVDANSSPLAGATVKIVRANNPLDPDSYSKDTGRRMARADTDGRFELPNVASGELHLAVEHEDWGLKLHRLDIPQGTPSLEVTVRVGAGARLSGVVRELDGRPTAKAHVTLTAVQVPGLRRKSWWRRTDEEGRFEFEQLADGVYLVATGGKGSQGGKGGQDGKAKSRKGAGKNLDSLARYVRISSSKRHQVVLTAAGGARLTGTITATVEVPALTVTLTPLYPDGTPLEDQQPRRRTMARGGTFTFEGVMPARYRIDARPASKTPPYLYGSKEIEVSGTDERRVDLRVAERRGR